MVVYTLRREFKVAKYKNEKANIDGYSFDSKVEAKYYEKLKVDKAKGTILNFELQPQYVLMPKFTNSFGKKIQSIIYKADFVIYELDNTQTVIDIKGFATPESLMKKKMYQHIYSDQLVWLSWYGGEWIDYDVLIKGRRERKKEKAKLLSLQENL